MSASWPRSALLYTYGKLEVEVGPVWPGLVDSELSYAWLIRAFCILAHSKPGVAMCVNTSGPDHICIYTVKGMAAAQHTRSACASALPPWLGPRETVDSLRGCPCSRYQFRHVSDLMATRRDLPKMGIVPATYRHSVGSLGGEI